MPMGRYAPGVYVEEVTFDPPIPVGTGPPPPTVPPGRVPPIPIRDGAVAAFIGHVRLDDRDAARAAAPALMTSWEDYAWSFGLPSPGYHLADAVHGFFANGGEACRIVPIPTADPRDDVVSVRDHYLAALEALAPSRDLDVVCAPDLVGAGLAAIGVQGVFLCQERLISQCATQLQAVALLDPLPHLSVAHALAWVRSWSLEIAYDSAAAALFYPWVVLPGLVQPERTRLAPPCGHIAGLAMRQHRTGGVHHSLRGATIADLLGVETVVSAAERAALAELHVNVVAPSVDRTYCLWSATTLAHDSDSDGPGPTPYRALGARRWMNRLRRSIVPGLAWAVAEPSSPTRDTAVVWALDDFFRRLWQEEAWWAARIDPPFIIREVDDEWGRQLGMTITDVVVTVSDRSQLEFRVVIVSPVA